MTKQFEKILEKAAQENIKNARTQASLQWFRLKVASLDRPLTANQLAAEKLRRRERFEWGKMYNFRYDPKTKKTLPYYDMFPLCIPLKPTVGGFLGLNLHYLDPKSRAVFLNRLRDFEKTDPKNELFFKFTYSLLNGSNKYSLFRPCIKRYLFGHIRSQFLKIYDAEWNICLFLPTEMFVKEKKLQIWQDSLTKV